MLGIRSEWKEKLVVLGVFTGLFLPLRIVFIEYVSEYWLGSLGLFSGLVVLFMFLSKKDKLGILGNLFEKHMKSIVFGKTGKIMIAMSILSLIYFVSSLEFIERGNTVYSEDKSLFYDALFVENNFEYIKPEHLQNIQTVYASENRLFSSLDYAFSITYAVMNSFSEGWLEHIYFIFMIENIEILCFFVFYRTFYKNFQTKIFT